MNNKITKRLSSFLLIIGALVFTAACDTAPQTTPAPTEDPITSRPPETPPEVSYLECGLEYVIDSDISCHITGIGSFKGEVLEIPSEDKDGRLVSYIDIGAFKENTTIKEVIIPSSVKEIRQSAFRDCSSITKFTLPEGLTTLGSFVLYGLSSLEQITLPASLNKIGEGNLVDCPSLKAITVPEASKSFKSENGILYSKDMKTLILYPIAKTEQSFNAPEGVVTIGKSSFKGCKSIKTVVCSSTVENVGDFAFRDCPALETLTLGKNIKRLGVGTCYDCKSLSTVNYPNSKEDWDDDEKMILANTWDRGAGKYTVNYEYQG